MLLAQVSAVLPRQTRNEMRRGEMNDPSDCELLARYLSGECSDEEQAEVEALIASDPEKQRLIASMSSVWATPDPHSRTPDVSRLWGEIAEKTGIATTPQMPSGCTPPWSSSVI